MRINDKGDVRIGISKRHVQRTDKYRCLGIMLVKEWASEQEVRGWITVASNDKKRISVAGELT